jgi:hypothetical protein
VNDFKRTNDFIRAVLKDLRNGQHCSLTYPRGQAVVTNITDVLKLAGFKVAVFQAPLLSELDFVEVDDEVDWRPGHITNQLMMDQIVILEGVAEEFPVDIDLHNNLVRHTIDVQWPIKATVLLASHDGVVVRIFDDCYFRDDIS